MEARPARGRLGRLRCSPPTAPASSAGSSDRPAYEPTASRGAGAVTGGDGAPADGRLAKRQAPPFVVRREQQRSSACGTARRAPDRRPCRAARSPGLPRSSAARTRARGRRPPNRSPRRRPRSGTRHASRLEDPKRVVDEFDVLATFDRADDEEEVGSRRVARVLGCVMRRPRAAAPRSAEAESRGPPRTRAGRARSASRCT